MRSSQYIFVEEMDILANRYNTMKEVKQEYYKSTKERWYLTCSLGWGMDSQGADDESQNQDSGVGTYLVALWLRIHLPIQGRQV